MTYNQFVQAVELKMKEVVSEDTIIHSCTAEKNNGVKRKGISIFRVGNNVSPTIYLEEYYEYFVNGCKIEEIVEDILRLYREVRLPKEWNVEEIDSFDVVKNRIVYRLVNYESNSELLESVPYISYMDLAIIFYVMVEINEVGTACMLIRNEHLEMWNTDTEEVYRRAQENTFVLLPAELHSMQAMMQELKGEGNYFGENILYVLTNKLRSFGATTILYEGCLKMIGDYLEDDFFVLPSSVHEVIIISVKNAPSGGQGLSEMVTEINNTQVEREEVLSNGVYYYDREQEKLLQRNLYFDK